MNSKFFNFLSFMLILLLTIYSRFKDGMQGTQEKGQQLRSTRNLLLKQKYQGRIQSKVKERRKKENKWKKKRK